VGPDETVLEDEGVDAVVDLGLGGIGSSFEKQNVIFIKLRFKVPFAWGMSESSFVNAPSPKSQEAQMSQTVAYTLVEVLEKIGVKQIFGLIGARGPNGRDYFLLVP
jgi:hypothetical protein